MLKFNYGTNIFVNFFAVSNCKGWYVKNYNSEKACVKTKKKGINEGGMLKSCLQSVQFCQALHDTFPFFIYALFKKWMPVITISIMK